MTSSFTAYPDSFCEEDVRLACVTAESMINECLDYAIQTDTSQFSSCTCRPELLRQDYTCEYLGNATCLGKSAALSNLWGYAGCSDFAAAISSATVSMLVPYKWHILTTRIRKRTVFLQRLLPQPYRHSLSRQHSQAHQLRSYPAQRNQMEVQMQFTFAPG